MTAHSALPAIQPVDRLGMTLFFAVVLHALLILGVTFQSELLKPDKALHTMEITLVPTRSQRAPEDPDYLAQVSNRGAGNVSERIHPTSPRSQQDPAHAADAAQASSPPPSRPAPSQPPQRALLTQRRSSTRAPAQTKAPSDPRRASPSAAELINRSMEIASLSAEIRERQLAYAERLRHRYISANTQEYKYATYMETWRSKVERIGRLNYPEEARRRKMSGDLLLDVALNLDGSVNKITLRRSSGNKILDDAAIRIVHLAAPYSPLPEEIRRETDILHITRTWIFKSGNGLYTR